MLTILNHQVLAYVPPLLSLCTCIFLSMDLSLTHSLCRGPYLLLMVTLETAGIGRNMATTSQDACTSVERSWHLMVLKFFLLQDRNLGVHTWNWVIDISFYICWSNILARDDRTVNLMYQGIENLMLCSSCDASLVIMTDYYSWTSLPIYLVVFLFFPEKIGLHDLW